MKINIITTYSDKFIIGKDDKKPWNYEEIDIHFNSIISNSIDGKNALIMGYNTYLSNGPIKDHVNIVITTKELENDLLQDVYFVDSIGSSMEMCNKFIYDKYITNDIYIIGGEQIYEYFFKSYYYIFLDKVYITRINKTFEGNKHFYGLEEKFYYSDIKKSTLHEEIEYRVLQYDCDFVNQEMTYLLKLQDLLVSENIILDDTINQKIVSSLGRGGFNVKIDLTKYFPIFNIIKNVKDSIFEKIFVSFKKFDIGTSTEINLVNVLPYDSLYSFNIDNESISCTVKHTKGSMLNEVLFNIMFSSLLVVLMAKIMKLKPQFVNYKCLNYYYLEIDNHKIERIAWNTPDALPILNVKDRVGQYKLEDFIMDDLEFLGVNI